MGKTCAIHRCTTGKKSSIKANEKRKVKNKTLFKVPKDIVAFKKWEQAIPYTNLKLSMSNYICEDHFLEADLSRKYETIVKDGTIHEISREIPVLKKGAVPCFFMNEKNTTDIEKRSSTKTAVVVVPDSVPDQDIEKAKTGNLVNWDFGRLSESYRSIKLPSNEWAAAVNERCKFIQFISIQDEDLQRGLRLYSDMKMEILLDSQPVNLPNVHPPKSETDLVELLDVVSKLKVCRTAIRKKRSQEAQCYKFQE